MTLLDLRKAGFRYPGSSRWIFRDVDLHVEAGEVVHVVGRNGAGKSTLLKVLAGLLYLTEGTLDFAAGVKIAYMDQFSGEMLASDLTIAEQIKAAALKKSNGDISYNEILAQFGLGLQGRSESFIGHLSGGERQIIALSCVLAAGANVLCLDEFTSALDQRSADAAYEILNHAIPRGNALLVVSHAGIEIENKSAFSTFELI